MANEKSNTADREINMSRLLNAPIDLVSEVWTNPEHIKNWWGPDGFTNTITNMKVEPGGEWELVMHGPDGTNYPNRSVFREVVKHKKIVYDHILHPRCVATIDFESRGNTTFINWNMLFETREEFIRVVKTFKADEGLRQNLEKLDMYVQQPSYA